MALTVALEAPQLVDRFALIAPAGLGDHAPWWWHAISGRWLNWPALLRLPNPVAKPAVRAALRGFLEERLVHDRRAMGEDRKSTRLNSSHANISYAVFCL